MFNSMVANFDFSPQLYSWSLSQLHVLATAYNVVWQFHSSNKGGGNSQTIFVALHLTGQPYICACQWLAKRKKMRQSQQFLCLFFFLEKEMATQSSILAWGIPWTEKPGRLQSMESQIVRHDLETKQQQLKKQIDILLYHKFVLLYILIIFQYNWFLL